MDLHAKKSESLLTLILNVKSQYSYPCYSSQYVETCFLKSGPGILFVKMSLGLDSPLLHLIFNIPSSLSSCKTFSLFWHVWFLLQHYNCILSIRYLFYPFLRTLAILLSSLTIPKYFSAYNMSCAHDTPAINSALVNNRTDVFCIDIFTVTGIFYIKTK